MNVRIVSAMNFFFDDKVPPFVVCEHRVRPLAGPVVPDLGGPTSSDGKEGVFRRIAPEC